MRKRSNLNNMKEGVSLTVIAVTEYGRENECAWGMENDSNKYPKANACRWRKHKKSPLFVWTFDVDHCSEIPTTVYHCTYTVIQYEKHKNPQ